MNPNRAPLCLGAGRGTGKTATTHSLGVQLAERGRRVLLVDIDPQGSLTLARGADGEDRNLSDVLGGS